MNAEIILVLMLMTCAGIVLSIIATLFGPAMAYLFFAVIGGGFITYWSISDEDVPRNPDV